MPKYLMEAKFTSEGLKGLQRDGGTTREEVVKKAVASLGGQVESFHFALGENDSYTLMDLPDKESAAALSLAVSGTGAVVTHVVALLTPAELDAVVQRSVDYTRPGA